jgi:hypothetical protein
MGSKTLTDVAVTVRQIREKAIAVADGTTKEWMDPDTGVVSEKEAWYWLPKSQIEVDPEDYEAGDAVTVTLPEWLATDKGLL